jgi:hypothetical protein
MGIASRRECGLAQWAAQLESDSGCQKVFVRCPAVEQPAAVWLRGLLARIAMGGQPPLDVRVLLVKEHTIYTGFLAGQT